MQTAIELKRMSPFIKCFCGSNIITAAIIGDKLDVLNLLLSYKYKTTNLEDNKKLLMVPDDFGNIPLHYAYSFNRPHMRDLIRKYLEDPELCKKMQNKANLRGLSPVEMSHKLKVEETDCEHDDS